MTAPSANNITKTLQYCRKHAPAYLQSMYVAVLDNKINVGLVVAHDEHFKIESDKPMVVTVSDDIGTSHGPAGFNKLTLFDLIKNCKAATIITVWPQQNIYDDVVAFALNEKANVMIVETNMAKEGEWLKYITSINPKIKYALWSTNQQGLA